MKVGDSVMKKLASFFFAVMFLAVGVFFGTILSKERDSLVSPISQSEKMAELNTLKVNVADVFPYEVTRSISIPNGEIGIGAKSVLVIAKGYCMLSTDFTNMEKGKNITNGSDVITLDSPVVKHAVLRHSGAEDKNGSRILYPKESGLDLFIPNGDDEYKLIDDAYAYAQKMIEGTCNTEEYKSIAKYQAETVLKALNPDETLTIQWRDPGVLNKNKSVKQ